MVGIRGGMEGTLAVWFDQRVSESVLKGPGATMDICTTEGESPRQSMHAQQQYLVGCYQLGHLPHPKVLHILCISLEHVYTLVSTP